MADEYTAEAERAATNVYPLRGERPARKISLPDSLLFFDDLEPVTVTNDFVEGLLITGGMSVIYGEPGDEAALLTPARCSSALASVSTSRRRAWWPLR